jgi:flagellar basal body-associated protein FliL
MRNLLIVIALILSLIIASLLFYYFYFSKKQETLTKVYNQTTTTIKGTEKTVAQQTTTTLQQQTTTTSIAQTATTTKENEIELYSSGFSKNYVKLSMGTPLIIINKDSKTHNLNFEELEISYVLNVNDKLEFPTTEKGKFTIKDVESGSVLTLEVY